MDSFSQRFWVMLWPTGLEGEIKIDVEDVFGARTNEPEWIGGDLGT